MGAKQHHGCGARRVGRRAARRHGGSGKPRAHRRRALGDDRRAGDLQGRRSAARHLYAHLLPAGVPHGQARRLRPARRIRGHRECGPRRRRGQRDRDRDGRSAGRRHQELARADAVRKVDHRSAAGCRPADGPLGPRARRDADAGIQPRRRRHERSHADALQRARRSRSAALRRRHEPAAAELDAGRLRLQPAQHPGSRRRDERRRRGSRQRRDADQHDPEGWRQPVLGDRDRRLFRPDARGQQHHPGAARAASRSEPRRLAEEIPRYG